MTPEILLRIQPVGALVAAGDGIAHMRSLPAVEVKLPPLRTGQAFFGPWHVQETPEPGCWRETSYSSCAPPVFVARQAFLHSACGLLGLGGVAVAETLPPASVIMPGARRLPHGIAVSPRAISRLEGTHISVLAAGADNADGALLNGLARLAALPDSLLLNADSVLVPAGTARLPEMLSLLDLLPSLAVREVAPDESFEVDRLVLPLTIAGEMTYHPVLLDVFARLSAAVPVTRKERTGPRRIFLQTVGGAAVDDAALLDAVRPLGFVAVTPGGLTLPALIAMLRNADAVVAAHSAALAHIGFCRPGCLVVEVLMAEDVDWRFRRLAALAALNYDCVLGRGGVVSAAHLNAALAAWLGGSKAAA